MNGNGTEAEWDDLEQSMVFYVHIGEGGILQDSFENAIGHVRLIWDLTKDEAEKYFNGDFEDEEVWFIRNEVYYAYLDEYESLADEYN